MISIPLSQPDLGPDESEAVAAVMASGRLSIGPYLKAFEERMATLCGTRHAVAVNSGTAALHLIVRGLGLGPGDAVLTTPYSFVASSNVLLYEGVRPVFVDIDPDTYNIDLNRLPSYLSETVKGVLAVDVFGLPVDWAALTQFAQQHQLKLIDDACEAPGATVDGRPIGTWGDAAAFGFYPNKQLTTGEGGCLTTNSEALAQACRSMRNHGRASDARMEHVRLGFNYRMNELSAALGVTQVDRLPELLAARARVAAAYREVLDPMQDDLHLPHTPEARIKRSWFVYVIRLADHYDGGARDELMHRLHEAGIGCAPYFPCIHLQPYYRERFGYTPGDFPVAEAVSARTLALPFFPSLSPEAVAHVASTVKAALPFLPRAQVVC